MSEHPTASRSRSFAVIVGLYLVATAGALAVAASFGTESPTAALVVGFAVSVAFLYVASQIAGNGSTFDAWWSVMPPAFAIWMAVVFDQAGAFTADDQRRWLVAG
ncbi:MAG: hypothetical protein ACKPBG_10795, partial [Actinomycetota bacterium]